MPRVPEAQGPSCARAECFVGDGLGIHRDAIPIASRLSSVGQNGFAHWQNRNGYNPRSGILSYHHPFSLDEAMFRGAPNPHEA